MTDPESGRNAQLSRSISSNPGLWWRMVRPSFAVELERDIGGLELGVDGRDPEGEPRHYFLRLDIDDAIALLHGLDGLLGAQVTDVGGERAVVSAGGGRSRSNGRRPPCVIVHVSDTINPELAGYDGWFYESPAQPREQALGLVRVLLGPGARAFDGESRWDLPVAGGRRSVWLSAAPDPGSDDADTKGGCT